MAGKFDPNNAQNLIEIEKQFAVKAVEQAQTYWNLLEKVNPQELKLTKIDDEIHEDAMTTFPEFAEPPHSKLVKLDEDWMKSNDGKKRWREFMERVVPTSAWVGSFGPLPDATRRKSRITTLGCLIRTDAEDEYGEKNTIFVTRIQFYCIEIARNKLGLNQKAHELAKEEAAKEKAKKEREEKEKGEGEKEEGRQVMIVTPPRKFVSVVKKKNIEFCPFLYNYSHLV
ncbi:DUF757-domain-containing protein [Coprinellus micaceus]|uniref:DUF757-domain-containing protein n=1 Tax=Coprinellus micaceus TaxID=71717 RepID=A0A4Y7TFB8_COPMI|nr:DUF757-domain-containing protein [Coprinellus micaceus]